MSAANHTADDSILLLDGEHLTVDDLVAASRNIQFRFLLDDSSRRKMRASRDWVRKIEESGAPVVYGVNTGFGSKATVSIGKEHLKELQRNLIMSHSAGVGDALPIEIVRGAMILRANTLARGFAGIRLEVVETLLQMLEKGVTPWIPAQGSVGASGDLAPLSHLALVLSKDPKADRDELSGKAYFYDREKGGWQLMSGKKAMKRAGIERQVLGAKEGLALNNGTQISTALLAFALFEALHLVKLADIAMAMTLEALQGISLAFRQEIHELRPYPGQIATAENIRRITCGSKLLDQHPEKVQDAYSLRCHPQVLAGVRDTMRFIQQIVDVEMNSSNDNPIILPDIPDENKAIAGGNFHAQPIAFAADFLAIVLCEVGSIAERRIFRLSDRHLNEGLPSFLIARDGLDSGLMLAQYTAAALVSENKSLAHPASVDSIPTCENQEDHVSMAPIAARKAWWIIHNVQKIVAIELLFAAQALDLRARQQGGSAKDLPALLGKGSYAAYRVIRDRVPFMEKDRPIYRDIDVVLDLVRSGGILGEVEKAIGALK